MTLRTRGAVRGQPCWILWALLGGIAVGGVGAAESTGGPGEPLRKLEGQLDPFEGQTGARGVDLGLQRPFSIGGSGRPDENDRARDGVTTTRDSADAGSTGLTAVFGPRSGYTSQTLQLWMRDAINAVSTHVTVRVNGTVVETIPAPEIPDEGSAAGFFAIETTEVGETILVQTGNNFVEIHDVSRKLNADIGPRPEAGDSVMSNGAGLPGEMPENVLDAGPGQFTLRKGQWLEVDFTQETPGLATRLVFVMDPGNQTYTIAVDDVFRVNVDPDDEGGGLRTFEYDVEDLGAMTVRIANTSTNPAPADITLQHIKRDVLLEQTSLGGFSLESSDPDEDLRESPARATLTLHSGAVLARVDAIANDTRDVDPDSGRPRAVGPAGPCPTGAEPACLPGFQCIPTPIGPDPALECDVSVDVNGFRALNGATIGITSLDPSVGSLTFFNSTEINLVTRNPTADPLEEPTLASFVSALLAADPGAVSFAEDPIALGVSLPVVAANRDPGDAAGSGFFASSPTSLTLARVLSPEQQALAGCGPFYGAPASEADCDVYGVSLLLSEAGALLQSWPGFGTVLDDWDLTDPTIAQPGTVSFEGVPVATRCPNGQTVTLPGARDPADDASGYDPSVDGCIAPSGSFPDDSACALSNDSAGANALLHPFFDPSSPFCALASPTGQCPTSNVDQRFANEMAAISWNLQMLLVAISSSGVVNASGGSAFDPSDPFAREPGNESKCSFRKPQLCVGTRFFLDRVARELDDDPSGPPQWRWIWETGAEFRDTAVAEGDLAPFSSWTFHALGPAAFARGSAGDIDEEAVLFVLGPPDGLDTPPVSSLVVVGPGGGFVGLAVPEPSKALLQAVALLSLALLARHRPRRSSRRARRGPRPRSPNAAALPVHPR